MKEGTGIKSRILWGLLVVVLAGIIGAASWTWLARRDGGGPWSLRSSGKSDVGTLESLGVYGQVPDFSLIERSGRPVGLSDLRGKIWIANFVYTQCTETCPVQTAQMARLQADLTDQQDVRFVSVAVDPERDTPRVLTEYANRFGADPERWLFLTGKKEAIYHLAHEGFRLAVVEKPSEEIHIHPDGTRHVHVTPAGERIIHSSRLVLVDRQGQIRAYHHGTDQESLDRLRKNVRTLLRDMEAAGGTLNSILAAS